MRIRPGTGGAAVAAVLILAALVAGFNLGAALMLLIERGLFVPVLVPILLPEGWATRALIPILARG